MHLVESKAAAQLSFVIIITMIIVERCILSARSCDHRIEVDARALASLLVCFASYVVVVYLFQRKCFFLLLSMLLILT